MAALRAAGGYTVMGAYDRGRDLADAAGGVDVLVIATPDTAVAGIAARVVPNPDAVVVHVKLPLVEGEAAAAPVVAAETAEPEVIGRKATDEETPAE